MIRHSLVRRPAAWPLALVLAAACSDGGTAPTESATRAACAPARDVSLLPGDTAVLDEAQAACFSLSRAGSYLLAGYDTRAAEASRTGPEPGWLPAATYTVAEMSRGEAPGQASRSSAPATPAATGPRTDVALAPASAPSDADPYSRGTRWHEGERFRVSRHLSGEPAMARVMGVYDGGVVVAAVEGEGAGADAFRAQLAPAVDELLRTGVPLFRRVFGGAAPATSPGSEQLLVLLSSWDPKVSSGNAQTRVGADGLPYTRIDLNLNVSAAYDPGFAPYEHTSSRLSTLAHEVAHAWQARYLAAAFGPGALSSAPVWTVEGTADLLALETVRRSLGIGLADNIEWDTFSSRVLPLTLEPRLGNGVISNGYFSAASFLRDQQARLVRGGVDADAALAEVVRGALEGMHGRPGAAGTGLEARVGRLYGRAWSPEEGVLFWALAQAADDHTSLPELQNFFYRDVSNPEARFGRGWSPAVEQTLSSGSGERHRFGQPYGSAFYLRLQDAGGGTWAATADVPGSRWMVVRVK